MIDFITNLFSSTNVPPPPPPSQNFFNALYSNPLGSNAWNALKVLGSGLSVVGSGMWNAGIFRTTFQLGLPVAGLTYASYRLGKKVITSNNENVKMISTIGSALAGIWGIAELYKGYNIISCAAISSLETGTEVFASCII